MTSWFSSTLNEDKMELFIDLYERIQSESDEKLEIKNMDQLAFSLRNGRFSPTQQFFPQVLDIIEIEYTHKAIHAWLRTPNI